MIRGAGSLNNATRRVIGQVYTSILHTYNSEVVVTLANSCCALLDGCERAASTPNIAPQAEWLKALLIVCQVPRPPLQLLSAFV